LAITGDGSYATREEAGMGDVGVKKVNLFFDRERGLIIFHNKPPKKVTRRVRLPE
jgi:hypothetical protein